MKTKKQILRGLALVLCLSIILGFLPGNILNVNAADEVADAPVSLIPNGDFERVQTNWAEYGWSKALAGYAIASVVYDADRNSNVVKFEDPDTTSSAAEIMSGAFDVTGGANYELSLDLKQDAAYADSTTKLAVYIFWYDAAGNYLDANGDGALTDHEYYTNVSLATSTDWDTYTADIYVPQSAAKAAIRINYFRSGVNCVYIDNIKFEKSAVVLTTGFETNIYDEGWGRGETLRSTRSKTEPYAGTYTLSIQDSHVGYAITPAMGVVPGYTYTANFMEKKHALISDETGEIYFLDGSGGYAMLYFVDKNGVVLEETIINVGADPDPDDGVPAGEWAPATLEARAPANSVAAYIKFGIYTDKVGYPSFQIDDLVVTETVGEILQPIDRPMISNGDFENGTANWKNLQVIAGAGRDGKAALLVNSVNQQKDIETNAMTPVEAGTSYTVSFWAKRDVADTTANGVTLFIFYRDASGAIVDGYPSMSAKPAAADPEAETPTTEWEYFEKTFVVPEGVTAVNYRFYASSSFGDAAIYFDDLAMTKTSFPTNGDFSNGTASWKGSLTVNEDGQMVIPVVAANEETGKRGAIYSVTNYSINATPGETYILTFKAIRTANEARTGSEEDNVNGVKDSGKAYLGIYAYDADGAYVESKVINMTEDEWTDYTIEWTAGEGVANFKIELGVNSNSGAAFLVDDIKVVNVADIPPVVVAPEYSSYGVDFEDMAGGFYGWTGAGVPVVNGSEIVMVLSGSASAAFPVIPGASYTYEATGADAAIVYYNADGEVVETSADAATAALVLTGTNATVTSAAVYLTCVDANNDHKCDDCGVVLSACADADKNHNCDICNAVLSECVDAPTVDAEGNEVAADGICDICGAEMVTGPEIDESLSFYNVGLVLGADIRGVFTFSYKPATSPYTSFKVMIERNGVESELALTTSNGTKTKYLGYALNLSAKEMADEVTATIIGITAEGKEYASNPYTWSIKQGAIAMLDARAGSTDAKKQAESALIANMLNYGAKAQQNFEYNLENLATDGLKAEYAALIKTTTPEMSGFDKPSETGFTVKMTGTALNLASKVEILPQFYLPKNPVYTDYKAVVTQTHTKPDGTETTETFEITSDKCLTAGRYLAPYINDLAAAEMRDTLTITLYKGDAAVSATYTFSAESVCSNMISNYPDLIPALMNYGDCAYAVFG